MTEENTEVIKISETDPQFKYELSRITEIENFMLCMQCGTCTADCPVARFSSTYRPLKILRMALLGLRSEVLSSDELWLCASCYTCTDRCPRGVEFASVLRVLRNMAVDEGYIPDGFRELVLNVLRTGYAYGISESRKRKREAAGLPPLPESNPESLARLAETLGFSKQVEKKVGGR
ncbi:MAG: 4Fe-4S dicluster domain-containing protein [Candidatus Freyarchaeota archaeon]